jgi:predicted nucleotidyltransferase component of viral defense system
VQKSKQENHVKVIDDFLKFLNERTSDYILKGGTALMKCYGLDRFSEDIDFDAVNGGKLKKIVEEFCRLNGFSSRIAKNTDTVLRFMINYEGMDSPETPLKIEVSFRNKQINPEFHKKINGIEVYDIDTLAAFKAGAYSQREPQRRRASRDVGLTAFHNTIRVLAKNIFLLPSPLSGIIGTN